MRSVDLNKDIDEEREATYTIQFVCNEQIKNGGVALADTDDADIIHIFAITKANELYTIAIRKSFFYDLKASEEDVAKWCKIFRPVTFSLSAPHSLHAISSTQLLVSLSDGRLLQLSKRRADLNTSWNEVTYSDGKWTSSLRGLVRWQGSNTVQCDGTVLEQSTPLSLVLSPDKEHVFAVCMNHTLRVWNLKTGMLVLSQDILGKQREQHEALRFSLDPTISKYMQTIDLSGSLRGFQYYILTYSSIDAGEFKLWGARDANFGEIGVVDAFPDISLQPPDPDANNEVKAKWEVVDFEVIITADHQDQELELWVLMRSSRYFRLYKLQSQFANLARGWGSGWFCVTSYSESDPIPSKPSRDAGNEWLESILKPSRFPSYVIESALLMYQTNHMKETGLLKGQLKDRLAAAIQMGAQQSCHPDSEEYHEVVYQEWATLRQHVRDLDNSRWSVKRLNVDAKRGMPWVTFSDGCSVIRSCTRLEELMNNEPDVLANSHRHLEMPSVENESESEPKLPEELSLVISTAAAFGQSLGCDMRITLESELSDKFWHSKKAGMPDRLQELSESCRFSEIEDGRLLDLDQMLEPVGGIQSLDSDIFFSIIDAANPGFSDIASDRSYTKFGMRTLIEGARKVMYRRQKMFVDLLALVVFITTEVDLEETPLEYFDGPQIFEGLIDCIKQHQILKWLVDHSNIDGSSRMISKSGDSQDPPIDWQPTILESLFAFNLQPHSSESASALTTLTEDILDLLRWTIGGNDIQPAEDLVVHVLCGLIQHTNVDLADQLAPLLPNTPWATYVGGRLNLLKAQGEDAAPSFERAAGELSRKDNFNKLALESLLSPQEAAHFGQGLPNYYSHIIHLFETASPAMPRQVAHFANMALAKIPKNVSEEQLSQLLGSLFSASLQSADFDTAYSALTRHPSPNTLLPDFIKTILDTPKANSKLLSLPWPADLHRHIDSLLAKEAEPKLLAAWRLRHDDFPGAASALLPSLNALQASARRSRVDEKELEDQYLTIINLLECAGKKNAWVLSGGSTEIGGGSKEKRKVVTIDDLRTAYQKELDRRNLIDGGRYSFMDGGAYTNGNTVAGDAMDLL